MRYIIIITIALCSWSSNAQIAFYKQYSEEGNDFGQGIVQLADSSYVITGSSSSFTGNQSQAFLLAIDSLGTVLWSNDYGGLESEWGRRVLYKEGFGFYICGFTNSIGNGAYDFYLVKTDENGLEEWENSYGGSGWDKVNDAVMARDTGVVMVGETSSNSTSNKDVYIVKTDKFGDTLWTKTIGGNGDDWATSIDVYQDSTYLISGAKYIEDSLYTRGFFLQLDEQGTILWEDTIHTAYNNEINHFLHFGDTIQAIGNYYTDDDTTDIFRFSYKIGTSSIYWSKIEDQLGIRSGEFVAINPINQYRFMVYNLETSNTYINGPDLHVGTLNDGLGWFATQAIIAHEGPDIAGDIIQTLDGGVVMVGYTTSAGFGSGNIFIWKFLTSNNPIVDGVESVYNFVEIEDLTGELKSLKVYPNPTSHQITVETGVEENINMYIHDVYGKLVRKDEILSSSIITVSEVSSGVYTLSFEKDGVLLSTKRLIVH